MSIAKIDSLTGINNIRYTLTMIESKWMTQEDVAKYLRVSIATVFRYKRNPVRPMPFHKVGKSGASTIRIYRDELDAWLLSF